MPAAKYDFLIEQGADWIWSLQFQDEDVDLSGYIAQFQARTDVDASSAVIDLSSTTAGLTVNTSTRSIDCSVSGLTTATYTTTTLVHDLKLVSPSGGRERLIEGVVTLSKQVTR